MGVFSGFKAKMSGFLAKSMIDGLKSLGVPLINQPNYFSFSDQPFVKPPDVNLASLWAFFKSSPEVIAVVTAIAEDIVSDGWYLEGGKNNKLSAEDFLENSNAKQELFSWVVDSLVTGDGYLYKAKIKKEDIISRLSIKLPYEMKSINYLYNEIFEDKAFKDETFKIKWFKHIPASTMAADYNTEGEVRYWRQTVGNQTKDFSPEEIVRYPYMRINGEFYGFTPMKAILTELNILKNIKNLSNSYFTRGGVQNIFILEEETPDSQNYKLFKSQIDLASADPAKWKNMIVTGKVTREEINPLNKDMEYRELAKYMLNIIITSWGMPSTRLSDVLLEGGKSSAGGVNTEGYYRKISHMQDVIEDIINNELLDEYNVKLRFNRTYKQDEVREATIQKVLTDVVQQRINMGIVKPEWAHDYLQIPEQYRKLPEAVGLGGAPARNVPLNNLMKDPAKMASDEQRRNSVVNYLKSKGYTDVETKSVIDNIFDI